MNQAEQIVRYMVPDKKYPEIQTIQTQFRMQIVEKWRLLPGAKVLEIGCGQGDMTAVLAHAVGPGGHVTAVDIAGPDYGGPVTVGQSTRHLQGTPLGDRIDFRLQYDVLDPSHSFPADTFDFVVLAHCSWYFESLDQLRRVLLRVRPWARGLCFSEWDMEPQARDQVAHLLAVLIQGQLEVSKRESEANIRTPFSRQRLKEVLRETGWHIRSESDLDTAYLQDADWEINACLEQALREAETLGLPVKAREWAHSQIDVLRSVAQKGKNRSLPSYAIGAEKTTETDATNRNDTKPYGPLDCLGGP